MALESLPPLEDEADDVCPNCGGAGVVNITGPDAFGTFEADDCPDCEDGRTVPVPLQEFQIGERVQSHTYHGTVVEYVPQKHTDNLYVIAWDGAPDDTDLYPARGLSRAEMAA